MATKRLSDHDKGRLLDTLEELVTRPAKYLLLPLTAHEQHELVRGAIPEEVLKAFDLLRKFDDSLIYSRAKVTVKLTGMHYKPAMSDIAVSYVTFLAMDKELPNRTYLIPGTANPLAETVVQWAKEVAQLRDQAREAARYAKHCISMSTSIGQVQRVLPGLAEYAPKDVAVTLRNAERRSRIPSGLELDDHQYHNLMNMLAMGQLCEPVEYFKRRQLAEFDRVEDR